MKPPLVFFEEIPMLRCLCAFALCLPVAAGSAQDKAFVLEPAEKMLLELTNAERKKEDLPPLKANPLLFKAARGHSQNMAKQGKLEHELDEKKPPDRLKETGYRFQRAGENIAFGTDNLALGDIMKLWMESEGHKANIVNPDFTEIGLGIARNDKGEVYYTQVFAAPLGK
jgi:uncharacterized protein YkwD